MNEVRDGLLREAARRRRRYRDAARLQRDTGGAADPAGLVDPGRRRKGSATVSRGRGRLAGRHGLPCLGRRHRRHSRGGSITTSACDAPLALATRDGSNRAAPAAVVNQDLPLPPDDGSERCVIEVERAASARAAPRRPIAHEMVRSSYRAGGAGRSNPEYRRLRRELRRLETPDDIDFVATGDAGPRPDRPRGRQRTAGHRLGTGRPGRVHCPGKARRNAADPGRGGVGAICVRGDHDRGQSERPRASAADRPNRPNRLGDRRAGGGAAPVPRRQRAPLARPWAARGRRQRPRGHGRCRRMGAGRAAAQPRRSAEQPRPGGGPGQLPSPGQDSPHPWPCRPIRAAAIGSVEARVDAGGIRRYPAAGGKRYPPAHARSVSACQTSAAQPMSRADPPIGVSKPTTLRRAQRQRIEAEREQHRARRPQP